MITLYQYILEKLTINKYTEVKEKVIKNLTFC